MRDPNTVFSDIFLLTYITTSYRWLRKAQVQPWSVPCTSTTELLGGNARSQGWLRLCWAALPSLLEHRAPAPLRTAWPAGSRWPCRHLRVWVHPHGETLASLPRRRAGVVPDTAYCVLSIFHPLPLLPASAVTAVILSSAHLNWTLTSEAILSWCCASPPPVRLCCHLVGLCVMHATAFRRRRKRGNSLNARVAQNYTQLLM